MKKSVDARAGAPVDAAQRYTIKEAGAYLRISHASVYKLINTRQIRVLKLGRRTFVPGTEITRLSRLEEAANASAAPAASEVAKPEIKESTAYRLLDSRIHQALMKDMARQQALWDVIQKFDGKLEHLTRLVEKISENPPPREVRVAEASASQAQFLRLRK